MKFIYRLIGKVCPPGLIEGEYRCELVKAETKRDKSGNFATHVLPKIVGEVNK